MNIPQIQIQTTKGILGLQSTKATQQIEQPRASQSIQQPRAQMTMETTKPKLTIDSSQARADVDMKNAFDRTREVASTTKQDALEGTARRASEGSELMKIENGGNPISSIAARSGRQPYSSLGIKFIPSYGSVKVSFEPGSVDIRVDQQMAVIDSSPNKPMHTYIPGKVTGQMQQSPSIQIDFKL